MSLIGLGTGSPVCACICFEFEEILCLPYLKPLSCINYSDPYSHIKNFPHVF